MLTSVSTITGRCGLHQRLVKSLRTEGPHPKVQVSFQTSLPPFTHSPSKLKLVPAFSEAMKMILSSESPDSEDLNDQE